MSFATTYFSRRKIFSSHLSERINKNTGFIVVIPCYNEPNITNTLNSLADANPPSCNVEIIVVVNSPEGENRAILEQNATTIDLINRWKVLNKKKHINCHIIDAPYLPAKHAGAGLARKIGMDEGLYRFNLLNKPEGIIVSLDADATCSDNYFTEIENLFSTNQKIEGCIMYFEHPVSGKTHFSSIFDAVSLYELHLRYMVEGMRYSLYPYPFHTVGSCFAIKARLYARQGGMNKRKAGEDFYFLHKLFPVAGFIELNNVRVVPSPRPSERAPFGTGQAVRTLLSQKNMEYLTYDMNAFKEVKNLFMLIPEMYGKNADELEKIMKHQSAIMQSFLEEHDYISKLGEINKNCASKAAFKKRFFRWFDAFKMVKFLNYAHEQVYSKKNVITQAAKMMEHLLDGKQLDKSAKALLEMYRKWQKNVISPLAQQQ